MRNHLLVATLLMLLLPTVRAADSAHGDEPPGRGHAGCPADRAAELGHDPFHDFHKIMAPAWHQAWPNEDFEALAAVGPEFRKAFVEIAKMKPTLKTEARQAAFMKARTEFGRIVEEYAAAAEKGDHKTVYTLMPELHNAFEMTAATLLPVSYPEAEAIAITLNLILETHLPKGNLKGLMGSTETLVTKLDNMADTTTIPEELKDKQQAIVSDVDAMNKLARRMKDCCENNDMEALKEHAVELETQLKRFFEKYI